MKTSFGDMDIDIPRDRNGDFEPKLIQKHQTTLSGDIEEKIISMYAKGMTENDIAAHIEEIYGLDVSDSTISRVTDKILPIARNGNHVLWKKYMQLYLWMQYIIMCDTKDV